MASIQSIDSYGGRKYDDAPVEVSLVEMSSSEDMRRSEDLVHGTRVSFGRRTGVRFVTTTSNGAITPIAGRSHWGAGSNLPTVARTGDGLYTITYAATYTDALDVVEDVVFFEADGHVESLSTAGKVQCTVASNVISVAVFNAAGLLSDLGGGVNVFVRTT
jgi:hypothetical protein